MFTITSKEIVACAIVLLIYVYWIIYELKNAPTIEETPLKDSIKKILGKNKEKENENDNN